MRERKKKGRKQGWGKEERMRRKKEKLKEIKKEGRKERRKVGSK